MILAWLIVLLLVGGAAAWALGRNPLACRVACLVTLGFELVLIGQLWMAAAAEGGASPLRAGGLPASATGPAGAGAAAGSWIAEAIWPWIPGFGITVHLALDGMSLLLLSLTAFLGIVAVGASWTEISERTGFFHFCLMWTLAGVTGVFLAVDLFLFYFFWELMLIPMTFLIGIWGHENRVFAALKFFLFTQASGLLMLISILGLAIAARGAGGEWSFDYADLLGARIEPAIAMWLMLGFFVAFAVKLPAVPLHTWLPDAHTQAPTAGSILLAGLLLKTGGYGLIRFAVPLFPDASASFAPIAAALGAAGILYGGWVAYGQTDFKRLVAYTSVSHLGFVLIGVYAWTETALNGAVLQMICHGLSTGALFMLAGALQERAHTRDLGRFGGLQAVTPRMAAIGIFFAMASLGLPGLGNFVAEFLILAGAWSAHPGAVVAATLGLVLATAYSLLLVQRTFHGPNTAGWRLPDLDPREIVVFGAMAVALIVIGVYPQPFIDAAAWTVDALPSVGALVRVASGGAP
jgi:NADH-quinone oxidoreductase subunit M